MRYFVQNKRKVPIPVVQRCSDVIPTFLLELIFFPLAVPPWKFKLLLASNISILYKNKLKVVSNSKVLVAIF